MHMELGQYKYLGGNVLSLLGNHKEGKDRKVVTLVKSPDPSFFIHGSERDYAGFGQVLLVHVTKYR